MRRSAMLRFLSGVYIVTLLSTVAIAHPPRDGSFTQQQATGSVHNSGSERQSEAQVRQMLRRKANSGLVGILRGASGANSSTRSNFRNSSAHLSRTIFCACFK